MLITFEELVRTADPTIEFDENLTTDVIYTFLTRAQQEYISLNFLSGDSIVDNMNAVRRRSDVLSKLIKRTGIDAISDLDKKLDGGYEASFSESDYWMFLSGILMHSGLPTDDLGSDLTAVSFELINHYDLAKKVRTITNEPVMKTIPIVLEGDNKFVFYLSSEYENAIGGADIASIDVEVIYLAYPPAITDAVQPSLSPMTHNDIVKLAADTYMKEYKYLLGRAKSNQNQ